MTAKMYLDLGIKLVMKGDADKAILAFCEAIRLNPQYAPAYNNLGLVLQDTHQLKEAAACFCRAIELNPNDAKAYNNLGLVFMELGPLEKAEECFRRAMELEPRHSAIYNNLGTVLENLHRMDEARAAYGRALALNPNYPESHYNLGTFCKAAKQFEEAEAHLLCAIALRPHYLEAEFALACLYLLLGDFDKGWDRYEMSRRKRYGYRRLAIPRWCGEDLTGRSILLCWEYGFGDTIQFARYAGKVRKLAAKTTLWVQKPLQRLLAAAYPHVTVYAGDDPPQEAYDYVCSLISLPVLFKTNLETIPAAVPYKPAGYAASAAWRQALDAIDINPAYRVGVVWAGHPNHNNDANRSIPFSIFCSLFAVPQISWASLQIGTRAEDLTGFPYHVTDFSGKVADFLDTAELIENLDLVITVDTAVAHLAGTMGKKTWVLLPFDPDWRWQLEREDSPWYPSMTLFRQQKPGDWQEVLERVNRALQQERMRHLL